MLNQLWHIAFRPCKVCSDAKSIALDFRHATGGLGWLFRQLPVVPQGVASGRQRFVRRRPAGPGVSVKVPSRSWPRVRTPSRSAEHRLTGFSPLVPVLAPFQTLPKGLYFKHFDQEMTLLGCEVGGGFALSDFITRLPQIDGGCCATARFRVSQFTMSV